MISTDISYDLIDGIYDTLNGKVTYSGITYPVYKSIPKTPEQVYVFVGNVIHGEDGTKDTFIYYGTVQVQIIDESKERADMKLSQKILGVVRGLLKTSKGGVFNVVDNTLIVFSHESLNSFVTINDNGISKITTVDMYNFQIQSGSVLTDMDGNVYTTVDIGTQQWIAENLRVTHYADGSLIANITDAGLWAADTVGAYCYYNNDIANKSIYGVLYNWHVVNNASGLAYLNRGTIQESGWRVATESDYDIMETYLGGNLVAGGKLKETGITHWNTPNTGATNESGFTALPGGLRNSSGAFVNILTDGQLWTANELGNGLHAYMKAIGYNTAALISTVTSLKSGLSVRLVRDI